MALFASLLILAGYTIYFSGCLRLWLFTFIGNISLVLAFFTHFSAKTLQSVIQRKFLIYSKLLSVMTSYTVREIIANFPTQYGNCLTCDLCQIAVCSQDHLLSCQTKSTCEHRRECLLLRLV